MPMRRVTAVSDSYTNFFRLFCCLGGRKEWQFVSWLDRTLEFNGLINKVDLICQQNESFGSSELLSRVSKLSTGSIWGALIFRLLSTDAELILRIKLIFEGAARSLAGLRLGWGAGDILGVGVRFSPLTQLVLSDVSTYVAMDLASFFPRMCSSPSAVRPSRFESRETSLELSESVVLMSIISLSPF